jgi:predicted acetyltransferase
VQIRHRPSCAADLPAEFANHVYYEVHENYRHRGYGTKLLELGKQQARRLGLTEIVVSCWESNPASKRIIEKNGGRLEDEWPDGNGNCLYRYRIFLS